MDSRYTTILVTREQESPTNKIILLSSSNPAVEPAKERDPSIRKTKTFPGGSAGRRTGNLPRLCLSIWRLELEGPHLVSDKPRFGQ